MDKDVAEFSLLLRQEDNVGPGGKNSIREKVAKMVVRMLGENSRRKIVWTLWQVGKEMEPKGYGMGEDPYVPHTKRRIRILTEMV